MSPKGKTFSKCHGQPNDKKKSVSCDSSTPIMKKLDELDKEVQQLRLRQNMLATESAIQELAERGKRANNLIIYDIPESSSDQPLQRQEHDTKECKMIIASLTKKVNCDDIKVIRLGRQNSKNRNLSHPVKIQPDQTVMQREYLKYLRDELERRTSNGETDLTIKYIHDPPKIVNRTDIKN
ncbi:unnamed protein product [Euphydryas editha]|uniref:Uncharacterized protein n=1 Tax=Euphydryas editha TaxID=104508 RepID=A0AAU9U8I4_EUPED|nr:unnamed protein product [Euphydryas editha]